MVPVVQCSVTFLMARTGATQTSSGAKHAEARYANCVCRLDPAEQQQDQQNDEHNAEAARGVIAPSGAVRPGRQRAEQKNDHDDK